ncbi:CPBP family intramembrane glutamic endopeptidase [Aquibacillus kalidii]|uniref:CPBP family intramembrane glutamic endopeptidase n=1 Tax=Aquibacillus kalidii TaxID=2762597 RepID=UPI001645DE73|nr:CPBP family intramembrane glutamic endopeptidase [Aquibacillus kalidii]
MRNKQAEIIQKMTSRQVRHQVYLSQLILLFSGLISGFFLLGTAFWKEMLYWDPINLIYFGFIPGIFVVIIDIVLMRYVPEAYFYDGGINDKIFKNSTIFDVFLIALLVSISEELLFRGVIQSEFGLIIASTLFAVIHVRYLFKPLLFLSIIFLSFGLGILFLVTGNNLLVTVTTHFTIDFFLGLLYRHRNRRADNVWG